MGFLPASLPSLSALACSVCGQRFQVMYALPEFGLAAANEGVSVACGDCYRQITFAYPRAAARVVLAPRRSALAAS